MIDIEKEYQEIKAERENSFISLYDLFVFLRKQNPKCSDNKIATVLLSRFKKYNDRFNDAFQCATLISCNELDDEQRKILKLGALFPFKLSKRLHEPEMHLDFDELIRVLESIEDNGIVDGVPF